MSQAKQQPPSLTYLFHFSAMATEFWKFAILTTNGAGQDRWSRAHGGRLAVRSVASFAQSGYTVPLTKIS